MAETLFLRRHMGALRPVDAMGEEIIADLKPSDVVKAEITHPRNLRFHKKFFALLKVLFPHQDTYPTMRKFRAAVQIALGFGETFTLPDGRLVIVPDSIAFGSMDEAEFDALMQRFFTLAVTRIIPGIDRDDVRREWDEIMVGEMAA